MDPDDWNTPFGRAIGVYLNGEGIRERDRRGQPITDLSFVVYVNADDDAVEFTLPAADYCAEWDLLIDTGGRGVDEGPHRAGSAMSVAGRSLAVLREHREVAVELNPSVAASLAAAVATAD